MNRPTALLIVAWLWIIIGILIIAFGGVISFKTIALHNILDKMDVYNPSVEKIEGINSLLTIMHIAYIIVFVLFAVGVFAVISGFYLRKLRNWARLSLEIFSWFGLIYMVFCLIVVVIDFTLNLSATAMLVYYLIWMAIFLVSIILLRGKTVREAVKRQDTFTTPT